MDNFSIPRPHPPPPAVPPPLPSNHQQLPKQEQLWSTFVISTTDLLTSTLWWHVTKGWVKPPAFPHTRQAPRRFTLYTSVQRAALQTLLDQTRAINDRQWEWTPFLDFADQGLQEKLATQGLAYCYVRLQGVVKQSVTKKIFYTNATRMRDFDHTVHQLGTVKKVEFPTTPLPILQRELVKAWLEHRLVL